MQKAGRVAGMSLLAADGVVAGIVYDARRRIAALITGVYRQGKTLPGKAGIALTRLLPTFARLGGLYLLTPAVSNLAGAASSRRARSGVRPIWAGSLVGGLALACSQTRTLAARLGTS